MFPVAGVMILLAGLRGMGVDYYEYVKVYEAVPNLFQMLSGAGKSLNDIYGENGYLFVSVLTKTIVDNYLFFQTIIAVIAVYFLTKASIYLSPYPFISLLFYFPRFLNQNMGLTRAGVAQLIVLFSYQYIIRKKPWHFYFFVFTASFFHGVALVAFPLYFLCTKGILLDRKILMIISISSLLLIKISWIEIATEMINSDSMHFIRYASSNRREEMGLTFGMVKFVFLTFIYLFILPYLPEEKHKAFLTLIIVYIYATILSVLFHEVSVFVSRIGGVIWIVDCILVPMALLSIKKWPARMVAMLIVVLYGYIQVVEFFNNDMAASFYLPYAFGKIN
jgi:hypothetical protein